MFAANCALRHPCQQKQVRRSGVPDLYPCRTSLSFVGRANYVGTSAPFCESLGISEVTHIHTTGFPPVSRCKNLNAAAGRPLLGGRCLPLLGGGCCCCCCLAAAAAVLLLLCCCFATLLLCCAAAATDAAFLSAAVFFCCCCCCCCCCWLETVLRPTSSLLLQISQPDGPSPIFFCSVGNRRSVTTSVIAFPQGVHGFTDKRSDLFSTVHIPAAFTIAQSFRQHLKRGHAWLSKPSALHKPVYA